jgi:hypothetical protein
VVGGGKGLVFSRKKGFRPGQVILFQNNQATAGVLIFLILGLNYFHFKGSLRNITHTMNLSLFLFLIGILGFILNRKNLILMIISIEIMLLAVENLSLLSDLRAKGHCILNCK